MTEDITPRDLAILRHLGLYRVGVYPVLSGLFFNGNGPSCGIAVKRLAEAKGKRRALVQVQSKALPGKLSYATLLPVGCALVGVSAKRANPAGTLALNFAIGLEYFCCRGKQRRHRLERAELQRFFGDAAPPDNVFHVATDELGWPCVLRAYQVSRNVEATIKAIRKDLAGARRVAEIGPWISAGDYGAAVLVPWPDKVGRVRDTINRSGLADEIPVVVGVGPAADTVQKALKHEG